MAVIGIISDTHGLLRPEALSMIQGVQHIIHAGDIGKPEIIPGLAEIAPVTAIRGNVDVADWTRALPETACVTLLGRRFFVIHDRNDLWFDPAKNGYDGVISGHSHRANTETVDGVFYLNPGSGGPERFNLPISVATLHLEGNSMSSTIHRIA
jgi:putative phosphoesterase